MEVWRVDQVERPEVLSTRNVILALVLHGLVFLVLLLYALLNRKPVEEVQMIDLTVIVNENLDGEEGKPPPLRNPDPQPEPPKEKPKPPDPPKKPDPPKALDQIVTNVVEKKEVKKEEKPEKPPEEKKPEKTKEELRKERLERIRNSTVFINKKVKIEVPNADSANGRTARQTLSEAQIRNLLNQGYRPGTDNQLATSEKQRCLSLIQRAIEDKWNQVGPKIGREGSVFLSVRFNTAGGLTDVRLSRSCGDAMSDQAALSVARQVTFIRGLSPAFIAEYARTPLTLQYNVKGR